MNARTQRSPILSWPIWLKLMVGFVLAILLPLALALIAVQPGLREISLQNLKAFVSENGGRQRVALTNVLTQARANVEAFAANDSYNRHVTSLLLPSSIRTSTFSGR